MRHSRPLAIALIAAALAVPAHARTWDVPSECPTIQAGVDSAAVGDTVLVACDTYYEHDIVMKSGVCLTSEAGAADCVTIDAQELGRVIYCLDVDEAASIVGFTLTGGLAPDGAALLDSLGGGIYCENSSPTLTNCTFSGNRGLGGGGMACWENANPTLTDCTFSGNSYGMGGGMLSYLSSPTLTDCTFSGNTSYHQGGGGMSCYGSAGSSPTLTNCTFSGNTAESDGGGLDCMQSSPTLTNCTFSGNDAYSGGGMKLQQSSPTLVSCTFSVNTSEGEGGGVACVQSSPTLTDCEFLGNTTGDEGGGMDCIQSSPTLTNCEFWGNIAGEVGGGMNCCDSSPTLTDCTFSDNTADGPGGGMSCLGPCDEMSASLTSGGFVGSTAESEDGTRPNGPVITATDCVFSSNDAELGAGVLCMEVSAEFTGCTFSSNTASGDVESYGGGMLCSYVSPATLTSCTFRDNDAEVGGGGVIFHESAPTVSSCTFSGNTSNDGGGILCGDGAAATVTNSIIAFCGSGGAVRSVGTGSATLSCSDVYGNAGGDWEDCIAGQGTINDNFSGDPLFCDAEAGDFTIDAISPCCAENNPACGLVGAWGIGCDTPVEMTSWGAIKAMFR